MTVVTHLAMWAFGFRRAETQVNDLERACLMRHVPGKKRLVEIGVWHGVTTCCLLNTMDSDARLFAVDPYPKGRLCFSPQRIIAHQEVKTCGSEKVTWMRVTGEEASRQFKNNNANPVDFVFIDGDHSYNGVKADWIGWSPLVAPDGVVALHDSVSSQTRQIDDAGSARFMRETILRDERFELIDVAETLSVLRRIV